MKDFDSDGKETESARGNDIEQKETDPRGGIVRPEIGERTEEVEAEASYYFRH